MAVGSPPPLPKWAFGASADITEPGEALKELGWTGGATPDRPPAQFFNWQWNSIYKGLEWVQNLFLFYPGQNWRAVDDIGINDGVSIGDIVYAKWDDQFVLVGWDTIGSTQYFFCSGVSGGDTWVVEQSGVSGTLEGAAHNGADFWVVFGTFGTEVTMWTASTADGVWTDRTAMHAGFNGGLLCGIYEASTDTWIFGSNSGGDVGRTVDPSTTVLTKINAVGAFSAVTALAADGAGVVLAAGFTDLSRSTNGGASFSLVTPPVAADNDSQKAALWDSVNSRFLYTARRASDDQLVICESPTGATGTWTVHEVDQVAAHADAEAVSLKVGARGEVFVGGTSGDSSAFLVGTMNLVDWYGLDVPAIATTKDQDYCVVEVQDKTATAKGHFLVGAIGNDAEDPAVIDGFVAARTETNLF